MEIKSEPFGHTVNQLAKDPANKTSAPFGQQVSAKQELNRSILQASIDVNLSAGNDPMALLFKTALEGINDALKAEFGDNAIQKAHDAGLDVSPEATADRIARMSTAFFGQYSDKRSDLSVEDALASFVKVIGGGIDKGFSEARNNLGGLNVLEGDIATNIDKTYDLVSRKA